jgi:hypothetical protein
MEGSNEEINACIQLYGVRHLVINVFHASELENCADGQRIVDLVCELDGWFHEDMESFQLFYSAEKIERGEQLHFLDFDEGNISAEERQGLPLNCGSCTWLGSRVQGVRGQAAGKVDREVQRRRKVSSGARIDEDSASHRQICFFGSKFWNGQEKA